MKSKITKRILEKLHQPELIEILSEKLSPADYQSIMLEIAKARSKNLTPKNVLEQYNENRFVKISNVSPVKMMEFDLHAFSLLPSHYEALELSPVAPLGTVSAIAPVDQNNIVATIRNTELVSDATNVLALECAQQRKELLDKNPKSNDKINLAASHRVTRAQTFDEPAAFPHFKIFNMCSAGRDEGNYKFEIHTLLEHITYYLDLLNSNPKNIFSVAGVRLVIIALNEKAKNWIEELLIPTLVSKFQSLEYSIEEQYDQSQTYYSDLRFNIYAKESKGEEFFLIDGGFTDWTQKLLSNKKERLLISGIGSERLLFVFGNNNAW